MVSVATGGLFAASNLADSPDLAWPLFSAYRERTIIFFCIAAFLFMLSCMLAYISMALFLTHPNLPSQEAKKMIGPMLYRLPQFSFLAGFIPLTVGLINYFLCMVDGHATSACLVTCFVLMVLPTFVALYRASHIVPQAQSDALEAEEATIRG